MISAVKKFEIAISDKYRPQTHAIVEHHLHHANPQKKQICFVEGYTDEVFYKENLYKLIGEEKDCIAIIHNGDNGGKEAVIHMVKYCLDYYDPKMANNKPHMFIVDRDYDVLSRYNLTDQELSCITVLPCYSFENFYIYDVNIQRIIKKYFDVTHSINLNEFRAYLCCFINKIVKYCSWDRITVINKLPWLNHNSSDKKKSIELKITNPEFGDEVNFDPDVYTFISDAIRELKEQASNDIFEAYDSGINHLSSNINLIKGKILFGFFRRYLSFKKGQYFSPYDLYNIASDIDIDIKIEKTIL